MRSRSGLPGGSVVALALLGCWGASFAGAPSAGSVPVEAVMDYLHSVLEANQTFYTVHVVERMQRRRDRVLLRNGARSRPPFRRNSFKRHRAWPR
ncbi:MAG: hypothetical protein MRJ92_01375 [Nitrospira sp.]|nr:hypothetical protein [Nitrospira sp.]